jgi:hypothetical protein
MELTELQKTQIVYSHFTLEQWKLIARAVHCLESEGFCEQEDVDGILQKLPSAVL